MPLAALQQAVLNVWKLLFELSRFLKERSARPGDRFLHLQFHVNDSESGPLPSHKPTVYVALGFVESDEGILLTLRIATLLAEYSRMLTPYPRLKIKFWKSVMQHYLIDQEISAIDRWMTQNEQLPRVGVDFTGTKINGTLMLHVRNAMTVPRHLNRVDPADTLISARRESSDAKTAMVLYFDRCGLDASRLRLIQQLLEQVFAHPTRQFGVNMLHLSGGERNAEYYEVLATIMSKNAVYQIEDLSLGNFGIQVPGAGGQMLSPGLQPLVVAALNDDTIVSNPFTAPSVGAAPLKRLSLSDVGECVPSFAAVCSALRYGCTIEDLSMSYCFRDVDPIYKLECWRWLAFSLFYPRSKRLARGFKLAKINLEGTFLDEGAVNAFRRTLQNPVAELVYQGNATGTVSSGLGRELMSCLVVAGSRLYAAAESISSCVFVVHKTRDFEALCEEKGWFCLVVPGVGLGWVQAKQIVTMEHEAIGELSTAVRDGHERYQWIMSELFESEISQSAFRVLLETIGTRLNLLETRYVYSERGTLVRSICTHCVNLRHLDLESCDIIDEEIQHLLTALRGDLGARLTSLNLNANDIRVESYDQLVDILSSTQRVPVLRELRLAEIPLGKRAGTRLFDMLHVNKTLRILEIDDSYDVGREKLDAAYQNELLGGDPIAVDQKLAFLSVLGHPLLTTKCQSIDSIVVSLIFKFAATQVRRQIFWRVPSYQH
uniref:Uncharacterized protein n=1 Tax=Globisporangium ultimum (strain ATCC 200006 / CBS 805.95 / DAOM BR144) TaxID=431595 RepID=K3X7S2_GLOUD